MRVELRPLKERCRNRIGEARRHAWNDGKGLGLERWRLNRIPVLPPARRNSATTADDHSICIGRFYMPHLGYCLVITPARVL